MANVVKFKINGLSSALNNVYTRVTDLSRNELYSGETLVSDASGNVELDIGTAGSDGQGVIVYGDNYSLGNELIFKSFTGYGLIESAVLPAPEFVTQPQSQSVDEYSNASFTALAVGSGDVTYSWYKNGVLSGITGDTYSFEASSSDNNAVISCGASDSNGTALSADAILTVTSYVYSLNGTNGDIRFTTPISLLTGETLAFDYLAPITNTTSSQVLVSKDVAYGGMVTFETNGTVSLWRCAIKIDGVPIASGESYPKDGDYHRIEVIPTENLSIGIVGARWVAVGTSVDRRYFGAIRKLAATRAAGDLAINLNNKSQGATQLATTGGINATLTNYSAVNWSAVADESFDGQYVRAWLQSGQSLSIGSTSSEHPKVHANALSGAYLFNGIPSIGAGGEATADSVLSLTLYREQYRETHGYAGISKLKTLLNDGSQFIYAPAGQGGTSIDGLSIGSIPYQNATLMVNNLNARAADLGKDLRIEFIDWIHGENDASMPRSEYLTKLRAMHDVYKSLANAQTGQAGLPMLLDQSGASYAHEIAKTSFQYAFNNADAHMVMPNYILNRKYYNTSADLTHLNPSGYVIKGEYHGIAAHKLITNGSFKCLQPESYAIVGNTIEITMHVPVLPLVIDTTTLPVAPSYGFSYTPPVGAVIYPTVTVSGSKIILDIGTPPLTGGKIDCGYTLDDSVNTFGAKLPCTNIRDSQNIPSEISGYTLHNWLVQFDHTL